VSGADISEFGSVRASASEEQGYASTAGRGLLALASLEVPTLALIHGFCIGGGVGLSLSCDMRYAAEDAVFAIPAARLGLGYSPQGMQALLHLVGPAHTKEIFFTARRYTAPEAYDMGLVSRVFPKADLDAGVAEIADTIAENAPLTVRAAKLAVRESMRDPESRDFTAAHKAVEACFDSDDYREGVRAFLERRSPRFRGR
jgi:enoyl-CoA hydratase/carnithine racemase